MILKKKKSELEKAIIDSDYSIVEQLPNCEDINKKMSSGKYPLFYAIEKEDLILLEKLLKNGANVEIRNRNNLTPLYYAAEKGFYNIVVKLLNNKANPNIACGSRKETPIHAAIGGFIMKDFSDISTLNKIFDILVKFGANVNHENAVGYTILHEAVSIEDFEFIEKLIDFGIDINAGSTTPLAIAVALEQPKTVNYLLEKGADANIIDSEGDTLMDIAKQNTNDEITIILRNYYKNNNITVNVQKNSNQKQEPVADQLANSRGPIYWTIIIIGAIIFAMMRHCN